MKNFKFYIPLFFFFALVFVAPAYGFSDNFNACSFTSWTLVGSWGCTSGTYQGGASYDGTNYTYSSSNTYPTGNTALTYVSGATYWEIDMRQIAYGGGDPGSVNATFEFLKNTSTSDWINIACIVTCNVNGYGFSYSPVTVTSNTWYKFIIQKSSNNLEVKIYYPNGTILNDQTGGISNTVTNPDRIQLDSIGAHNCCAGDHYSYASFDNVIASVSTPGASSITTNLNSYTVNSTVQTNWVISDSSWQWYNTFDVQVLKNGMDTNTGWSVGSQTGVYFYIPHEIGSYQLNLRKYNLGIFSSTEATTTFTVYPEGQSSLMVASQIPVGKNFDINYTYGFTPDCSSNLCIIKALYQNPDMSYTYENSFPATATYAGTMYSVQGSIHNSGTYVFQLWYGGRQLDSKTATANYIYTQGQMNLSASFINISQSSYSFGQTMNGNYGVDNRNWSSYTIYLEFYNWDKATNTTDIFCRSDPYYGLYFPCLQGGNFYVELTNGFYDSNSQGNQLGSLFFIAGSNAVRLMAKNNTAQIVLNYTNFTLSATDSAGYGLTASANSVCYGTPVTYQIITPSAATFKITQLDEVLFNYSLNNSATITYVPQNPWGNNWQTSSQMAELWGTDGYLHGFQNLIVNNCGVAETPAPPMTGQDTVNFFASTSFLGILIFFSIVGFCTAKGGAVGAIVGIMGSIPVLYIAKLIPMWAVFLDAALIIVALAVIVASSLTKQR